MDDPNSDCIIRDVYAHVLSLPDDKFDISELRITLYKAVNNSVEGCIFSEYGKSEQTRSMRCCKALVHA